MLTVDRVNQYYRESHTLWDLSLTVPRGLVHLPHGPQRRRQDDDPQVHHGPPAARGRHHPPRRRAALRRSRRNHARDPQDRLRPARPRDLPAPHGRGESPHRPRDQPRSGRTPRLRDRPRHLSRAAPDAASPRRRPLGRPAAAARDRPRTRPRADVPHPRRADRRHPAEHRARDRRHHGATEPRAGHHGPAGRAEAAARPPRRRPLLVLDKGRVVASGAMAELDDALVRRYLTV